MKYLIAIVSATFFIISGSAWAHEGIATSHRDAIQAGMVKYIEAMTDHNGNGKFPIYDPSVKAVIQLKFEKLHDSVEVHGRDNPYFVTCADFVDDKGALYDLDFLVSRKYEVVIVLIHAKDGKKTKYDIH